MPRILIDEDDDRQRLPYRETFDAEGFEVSEARDGRTTMACSQQIH